MLGVKTDTLRKWEKRYKLIAPKKGENGYRLYSEQDVETLHVFVKKKQGRQTSPEAARLGQPQKTETNPNRIEYLKRQALEAIEKLDREKLFNIFEDSFRPLDLASISQSLWMPFLTEIGDHAIREKGLWIAREHFAVSLIREWMVGKVKSKSHLLPQVILFGPEGDMHELGMIVALGELDANGMGALYLGPNLPLESLLQTMRQTGISSVALSITKPLKRATLKEMMMKIREVNSRAHIFVAGLSSLKMSNFIQNEGGIFIGTNLKIGVEKIIQKVNGPHYD